MTTDTPRRIVLVRHARAEWSDVDDHDRPLAERGREEASAAGRWLAGSGVTPGLVLVTTATRGRETWKLIAAELPYRPRTVYQDRLYEAGLGELIAVIGETSDDVGDLLVLSGNPAVHATADALTGRAEGDLLVRMNRSGFPTAAIAILTCTGSWKDTEYGAATLTGLWTPHP